MLLNHKIHGQGTPVIVIHGLFGNTTNLGMLVRHLKGHFQVIAVDVRNHGQSFRHPSMHYNEMAGDLITLMDHLDIKQAHLVGHSMGGKIAMSTALNFADRVLSLAVADIAPVTYPPRHDNVFNGLKNIDLSTLNKRTEADARLAEYVTETGVRQFLLKGLYKTELGGFAFSYDLDTIINQYTNISGWPETDKQFTNPVIFIKGMNSNYINSKHKSTVARYFPKAKAKIIQGTGHWLHVEKPTAFNKIIADFLFSH